jgi:catechol 2,3-dioxygenase-like lactoylglutathione lyase family enzyme
MTTVPLKPMASLAAAMLAVGLVPARAETGDAQPPLEPLTDDVRANRAAGVGLNVADIERSKDFYTRVLGFKVAARVPAQGPVFEYLLGLTGSITTDTLVILTKRAPQPGATSFGRVVLTVPSGRKMAERAAAAGYGPEKIVEGTNIIKDPDGYTVELYQRPAPAPARLP